MSMAPQILEWSRERRAWRQDTMRQLVEQPSLTATDYTELATLCKADHGMPAT